MSRSPRIMHNGPHDTACAVLTLVAGILAFAYVLT